jgi:toxin ParE1/3/4
VKPLVIAEEAEHELAGSVAFYEKRQFVGRLCQTPTMDLAWRFTETPYNEIARASDRWPVGKYGSGHYRMERFQFIIHYLDMPDRIWIVAFAHTSRKPNYWKRRIPWAG